MQLSRWDGLWMGPLALIARPRALCKSICEQVAIRYLYIDMGTLPRRPRGRGTGVSMHVKISSNYESGSSTLPRAWARRCEGSGLGVGMLTCPSKYCYQYFDILRECICKHHIDEDPNVRGALWRASCDYHTQDVDRLCAFIRNLHTHEVNRL